MKSIHTVADTLKTTMPPKLAALGGVREEKRAIRVNWSQQAQDHASDSGVDLIAEIMGALSQEIEAETVIGLIQKAHAAVRKTETIAADGSDTDDEFEYIGDAHALVAKKLVEMADKLHRMGCVIILSPTLLTIVQSSTCDLFVRDAASPAPMFEPIGTLGGVHKVVINPYGLDNSPALIAAPEWFSYQAGAFAYAVEDDGPEGGFKFFNDADFTIDASKLAQLEVPVSTLRFV